MLSVLRFHFSGVASKNATLGVPRIIELCDATSNIKTPHSFFYTENPVQQLSLSDVTEGLPICKPIGNIEPDELELVRDLLRKRKKRERRLSTYGIFIDLKPTLKSTEIARLLTKGDNVCFCRGLNSIIISEFVFCDVNDEDSIYKLSDAISSLILVEGIQGTVSQEGGVTYVAGPPKIPPYPVKDFVTNHIHFMKEKFGLIIAMRTLFEELKMTFLFDGSSINTQHIFLLVAQMCHTGNILPTTRHGMRKTTNSVLLRGAFEETVAVLSDASLNQSKDSISGVTESIIIGKTPRIGTGSFDVIVPEEKCVPKISSSLNICLDSNVHHVSNTEHHSNASFGKTSFQKSIVLDNEDHTYLPMGSLNSYYPISDDEDGQAQQSGDDSSPVFAVSSPRYTIIS